MNRETDTTGTLQSEKDKINREWSESSANYNRIILDELDSFRPAAWQRQILSHFPDDEHLNILDIGCGPGFFSIILSAKGHWVTGIDGAEGMLEKARANIAQTGSTATIMRMDANELDFPDEVFDLVISRNVTHAIPDHTKAYTEWRRVLKPGGKLLIYDANWHFIETVPAIRREYIEDWRKCVRTYGSDFNENTDPDAAPHMDDTEHGHPLGDLMRPDYDVGILKATGFKDISYDRDITGDLWDDKEKTLYRVTPMFEICAVR